MVQVIWTQPAADDLKDIHDCIVRDFPDAREKGDRPPPNRG